MIYPILTIFLEKKFYEPSSPMVKKSSTIPNGQASSTAISIQNLGKTFVTRSWRGKKTSVTSIQNLTLDIPHGGIFVLLGSNGSVFLVNLRH